MGIFRRRLLAATILGGAGLAGVPAVAQVAPATTATVIEQATSPEEEAVNDIIVTGTLISNPNVKSASPVNVIGRNEIQLRQSNTAEELLRNLPGAVPSTGSAVNNGNNGAAYVDLRGLGPSRNIVLLDGQRIVPAGLEGRVDLNNIPLALIQRVDSLTGGAATTYGADAVSGVVNFITRSDFTGLQASASQQVTEQGDGRYFRGDVTVGRNFAGGRGNVGLSAGYQQSDPVSQGDRGVSVINTDSYSGLPSGSGVTVPARFTLGSTTRQIDPATGALVPTYALYNLNPFNLLQTPFTRYNVFGAAHFDASDGVQIYARGVYSKNTVDVAIAPSGSFTTPLAMPYSNPYLPLAARNAFCGANGLSAVQCAAAAAATSPSDPNFRTFTTIVSRRTPETGVRGRSFGTEMFDARAGVKIDVSNAINLDISGGYGKSTDDATYTGFVLTSRLRSAVYATNTTTCLAGAPGGASITAASECVPLNLFGTSGSITPAQAAYLTEVSRSSVSTTLAQARALLKGDIGVASPWASEKIGFGVGAEYRKYAARQRSDALSKLPGELNGSSGFIPDIDGGYEVYEAYGELIAPLVADRPFFHSLTLEGGLRYSHYKVDAAGSPTFNTTTYKGALTWEPVAGVKIRGNYQRAVRAPNIGELFTPATGPVANLAQDPCAGAAPLNNVILRNICLAQGAPAGSIGQIANPGAGLAASTVSGNPNLSPETSDSYTLGVVLQPKGIVPGLTLTADYFHIRVTDAISAPTIGDLLAGCFGTITAASASSAACAKFGRNPITGGMEYDNGTTRGLILTLDNTGTFLTDGVDVGFDYRHDLGFAKLNLNFQANWVNRSKFQATPASLNRECAGYYSVNCGISGTILPKLSWNSRTTLSFGSTDFSLLWRHISSTKFEPTQFATDLAKALASPATCPDPTGVDAGNCLVQPAYRRIKAYDYLDGSVRFTVSDAFVLTFTVINMFDRKPPFLGSTIGNSTYNSGNTYPTTYDTLGRRFAVSATVTF